ncbi:MAG TPA: CopG family transcriptional regulator [Firmicutes bacterium]|nr:CopG family transcriptional regulator [Bacillota bacterium]
MRAVLSVSLPEEMVRKLDALARETGRSKSDILCESLSLYLWESRLKRLKKRLRSLKRRLGW